MITYLNYLIFESASFRKMGLAKSASNSELGTCLGGNLRWQSPNLEIATLEFGTRNSPWWRSSNSEISPSTSVARSELVALSKFRDCHFYISGELQIGGNVRIRRLPLEFGACLGVNLQIWRLPPLHLWRSPNSEIATSELATPEPQRGITQRHFYQYFVKS
jgi:hypothetical protein